MKPVVEQSSVRPDDPRNAATQFVPRVSQVVIREVVDPLPALVRAIDRSFAAGWKIDLKTFPHIALDLFFAKDSKGQPLVTDVHWAAYAREAGLSFTPDEALRCRVIAFYQNGRK